MTRYDPAIVLDGVAALARATTHDSWPTGQCLGFVDRMLQKGDSDRVGYYRAARDAREATPLHRRHSDLTPPAGAIVYFTNGSAPGHIAISAGGGNVRSTDKLGSGRVATVSIRSVVDSWGGRPFAFWTDWIMGYSVRIADSTATASVASSSTSIARIQQLLNNAGASLLVDGVAGPKTRAAILEFQKAHGLAIDGIVGPRTLAALSMTTEPASSSLVAAVQQKLKTTFPEFAGSLAVDGLFGPATRAAVTEFQRRSGLSADGIVGPKTRAALGV